MNSLFELVSGSEYLVVFTGAGISTESGLPDFRSQHGVWQKNDPFQVATADVLADDPEKFFDFYRTRLDRMSDVDPNRGHVAVARLEQAGIVQSVITQNVDGLHQKAGSRRVVELHGSLARCTCTGCDRVFSIDRLRHKLADPDVRVPYCDCGGILRPGVVLFGEPLPYEEFTGAVTEAARCDAMIIVGSSLVVYPAAGVPVAARRAGAKLAIVNDEATPLDEIADIVVRGGAGEVLGNLADEVLVDGTTAR